ncbi:hypothetical protein SMACR_00319 [Sordaria macrospora]|uniref:WGS project CABT00000000 data, contig 2.1 n=2 Tax=Sordaria macrospora TaxID=5147 RepID=F7VKS5_SORMK|nr:uncharacterized protein SMAC_00319 [Sordaria macrospora k-hell]KAA8636891.1 hypothetical protein SMACR_00319 [Sordaria macrospora]WPJ59063.1 hypothetical protein SMAC4_00319 [Sordaria macrospora]CCC06102.1 unnamed protein product [Sordaria macrospora k-hell]
MSDDCSVSEILQYSAMTPFDPMAYRGAGYQRAMSNRRIVALLKEWKEHRKQQAYACENLCSRQIPSAPEQPALCDLDHPNTSLDVSKADQPKKE